MDTVHIFMDLITWCDSEMAEFSSLPTLLLFETLFYVFIFTCYAAAPGLSCSMWDLVPWPGIEPRIPDCGLGVSATEPPGKCRDPIANQHPVHPARLTDLFSHYIFIYLTYSFVSYLLWYSWSEITYLEFTFVSTLIWIYFYLVICWTRI